MQNVCSSYSKASSSYSNNQSKLTHMYNRRFSEIEKSFAFHPEKIFSDRITRWLNHQMDVRLLDQAAMSWYLIGTTAHICSEIYVYRNNREPIPNNLYAFLVCGSAFGKSAFYQLFLSAIGKCRISDEVSNGDATFDIRASSTNNIDTRHFLDEMSRGGLLKQLSENDKVVLLDEADSFLKRNGLIIEGPIREHNNVYEIILTLYSGKATVIKSLTNSTTSLFLHKLNILANTTEEPILRLMKKKFSGELPNPFAERSLFLFVSTQLTLERPFPLAWDDENEPTVDQIMFTSSLLMNLKFYYGTSARFMTVAHGNLLSKLMIKNEKRDKWLTARLGKSRDHLHRLAVNLQLIQLTFDLLDQYKTDFGSFNIQSDNIVFQQRMKQIVNTFLGRTSNKISIKLEIRLSIANAAVKLLNLLLHQYLCIFGGDNTALNTDDLQMIETITVNLNEKTTATTIKNQQETNEQSIKDLARAILLHDEIAFTRTKLSNCVPLWKRKSNHRQDAIELLIKKKLIITVEKAAKQILTRRTFNMWLKCVPKSFDLTDLEEFQQSLAEFNIDWDIFQRTLWHFQPPVGIVISTDLANRLKAEHYKSFIKFNIDVLTGMPNDDTSTQDTDEQNNNNNNHHDRNAISILTDPTTDERISSLQHSTSNLQDILQSNPFTTATNSTTSIIDEVSTDKSEAVTGYRLPRPKDLVAARNKQAAVNRSCVIEEK